MKFKFNSNCLLIFYFIFFLSSCTLINKSEENELRLAYMPNVTHATALIGIEKEIFQHELGGGIKLKTNHFVVGNSIIDAFITNQIDIAYIGPGPFINAIYRKVPVKLLSGAAYGGTVIIGDNKTKELNKTSRVVVPQYGNTQDLILRIYLQNKNLLDKLNIIAIPMQDTGSAFFTMSVDAACLPEPWGTILLEKGNFNLIEDEKSLFANGKYPVTLLIVKSEYQKKNPDAVKRFIKAHEKINMFIAEKPELAAEIVAKSISNISRKKIDKNIIEKALSRCSFSDKLDLSIMEELKSAGVRAGYYKKEFLNENICN